MRCKLSTIKNFPLRDANGICQSIRRTIDTSIDFITNSTKANKLSPSLTPLPSHWHPSLQCIYARSKLLNALLAFMTRQYNEENIMFCICVRELDGKISETGAKEINIEIEEIYRKFIQTNAPKQVNLSSECFAHIMSMRETYPSFDLEAKKAMFVPSVLEIEKLISTSVLYGFYDSKEFESAAALFCRQIPSPIDVSDEKSEFSLSRTFSMSLSPTRSTRWTPGLVDESSDAETPATAESPLSINEVVDNKCSDIEFDIHSTGIQNSNTFKASSTELDKDRTHEWSIKIGNVSTTARQEIGIVSNLSEHIKLSEFGLCDTPQFGARVLYGMRHNSFYYASFNENDSVRCNKDLSSASVHKSGWKRGDVIKLRLNLSKGRLKFYLNDKKVGRTISVQKRNAYYPIVCYSGKME